MRTGTDSSKFFEHGVVQLKETDFINRHALLHMCMPNCLFQAITPTLLGSGLIDDFKIKLPTAVWMPQLSDDRIRESFIKQVPELSNHVNTTIKQKIDELLRIFIDVSQVLQTASDIIPMLPLGTYVEFQYRCEIDNIAKILCLIEATPSPGVHEFRWALAEVLAYALSDLKGWEFAQKS